MYNISLVVGDWSGDGHNRTETFIYESSISKDELKRAFARGCKRLGLNFDELCAEYEDNEITWENLDVIIDAGFPKEKLARVFDEYVEGEANSMYPEGYAELWMFVAKVGDRNLTYDLHTEDDLIINIGGYGLFE